MISDWLGSAIWPFHKAENNSNQRGNWFWSSSNKQSQPFYRLRVPLWKDFAEPLFYPSCERHMELQEMIYLDTFEAIYDTFWTHIRIFISELAQGPFFPARFQPDNDCVRAVWYGAPTLYRHFSVGEEWRSRTAGMFSKTSCNEVLKNTPTLCDLCSSPSHMEHPNTVAFTFEKCREDLPLRFVGSKAEPVWKTLLSHH